MRRAELIIEPLTDLSVEGADRLDCQILVNGRRRSHRFVRGVLDHAPELRGHAVSIAEPTGWMVDSNYIETAAIIRSGGLFGVPLPLEPLALPGVTA